MNMYGGDGNDEKCGEINFGLDYDFSTQTLKLKIIQVHIGTFINLSYKNSDNIIIHFENHTVDIFTYYNY